MKIQVNKTHYDFDNYVNNDRWNSYYYQIRDTLKCEGNSVLIIGVGDGIVANVLRNFGKNVTTFDFDESLNPDIVGDVTKIDEIIHENFDIIVCCQVLEHIPFEKFEITIKKIQKIVNEKFILSLPNRNIWFKFGFKLPLIGEHFYKLYIKRFRSNNYSIEKEGFGEHYREIDAKKGWMKKDVKSIIEKYFKISDIYIPIQNTYHVFYVLEK